MDDQPFDMAKISEQMIMGWTMVHGVKIFISFVYGRCSMAPCMNVDTFGDGLGNFFQLYFPLVGGGGF